MTELVDLIMLIPAKLSLNKCSMHSDLTALKLGYTAARTRLCVSSQLVTDRLVWTRTLPFRTVLMIAEHFVEHTDQLLYYCVRPSKMVPRRLLRWATTLRGGRLI